MNQRREYSTQIIVNGRKINKVIIDPHYQLKHSKVITDEIILELVKLLDKGTFPTEGVDDQFEYFIADRLKLKSKSYKLVWLLEKKNVYRSRKCL